MSCNCENIESKLSDIEGKLDQVLEIVNDISIPVNNLFTSLVNDIKEKKGEYTVDDIDAKNYKIIEEK